MLLTFQAPTLQPKSSRMAKTNTKNFGQFTPSVARKTPNHWNNKKGRGEGELEIVGQELKK